MRIIFAPRNTTSSHREAPSRCTLRSLLDARNLSGQSKTALAGELQIRLETAFDLFIDARTQGYRLGNHRLDADRGRFWQRHSSANTASAKRVWARALENPIFTDIARHDVALALKEIRNLPKYHGKYHGERDQADEGGRIDEDHTVRDRISAGTYMRIGRTARQVRDLLVELDLAEDNPFDLCRWSLRQEKRLRQQDRPIPRRDWPEAVEDYLGSPIFKGDIEDAGDPLFWVPLLMRLGGLRLGEAVYITPEDLQYRDGMPVICIDRNAKAAGVEREIPVSRPLQDLGLIRLFELRQGQNEMMLFPQLTEERVVYAVKRFRWLFLRYCRTHEIDPTQLKPEDFREAFQRKLLGKGGRNEVVRMAMGHVPNETGVPFPDGALRSAVHDALFEASRGLPDIIGPFCS